jgi:hypothetical protein
MLVPNQTTIVKINKANIQHYKELGYECNLKDKIEIQSEHLTVGSHVKVSVKCDICDEIIIKEYKEYIKQHTYGYDVCSKCATVKRKDTFLLNYGVEHPLKLKKIMNKRDETNINKYGGKSPICNKEIKDKIKNTNISKYGVEYPMQSKEILEKSKLTNLERYGAEYTIQREDIIHKTQNICMKKYGVKHPLESKDVMDKMKKSNYEKYGVEYIGSLPEIHDKIRQTYILKYGVDHYLKTEDEKEKMKQRNLNKFGCEYTFQSDIIKSKIKETNLNRYGNENYLHSEEGKSKVEQTNLKKYGYKNASKSPIIIEKRNKTFLKNDNVPTSSQQIELYKMIQEQYSDAILNYPCDRSIFDIALIMSEDIKIDIEYDGNFWHQDQQRDRRRDEYHKSKGWKILRIKSGHKLPDVGKLFEAIDYLITTNHHFKEIIMSDWVSKTA